MQNLEVNLISFLTQNHCLVKSKATGTSMIPAIYPGDHIFIRQNRNTPRPGEILVVKSLDQLIVHRLIETKGENNEIMILKGDNNNIPDPPVSSENIIGIIVKTKPTLISKLKRQLRSKLQGTSGTKAP